MEKFNAQIPLRYGIIAFALVFTVGMMMYVFYEAVVSSLTLLLSVGILSVGIVIFLAIWSGISYRKANGGVISFGHAFLAVFIVFLFHSLANVITQNLINKVIDTHYSEKASALMKEKMSDRFEKMNMTDDQIKDATRGMGAENFDPPFSKQIQSLLMFLGFFGFVSAIIAAFIKRGSSDLISSGAPPEPMKTI